MSHQISADARSRGHAPRRRRLAGITIDSGSITAALVIILSAAYAVMLPTITRMIGETILGSEYGTHTTVQLVLKILTFSFLVLALVVATVVVTNAYVLVTAARTREIALRRLLGAGVDLERRRIAREGLLLGILGSIVGIGLGVLASWALLENYNALDQPLAGVTLAETLSPLTLIPIVALIICARTAAWRGSRGVLDAHPIGALGVATMREAGADERGSFPLDARFALAGGTCLLLMSLVMGLMTPLALLVGLMGGVLGTYGFLSGSSVLLPWAFDLIDALLPKRGYALHASRNLRRYPVRTARASLGVTVSVALVTMFVVATASFDRAMNQEYEGVALGTELTRQIMIVAVGLIGVTAIISALGLATTVNLGARLRSREIALTRVLGMRSSAAARVIVYEAARLAISATLVGFLLGGILGWMGVQATIASTLQQPLVMPVVPLIYLPVLLLVTCSITLVAAAVPSRRVLQESPMAAYVAA